MTTGGVSLEKVSSVLPPGCSVTNDVEHCVSESDVLPDLSSFYSKSETVSNDISVSGSEQVLPSKGVPRKLLLLSPVKSSCGTSEPSTSLSNNKTEQSENAAEHVETSLTSPVGKRLILDALDKNESSPLTSVAVETAASDAGEVAEVESEMPSVPESVVVDRGDVNDKVQPPSATPKISSRISRLVLSSNVPLPQLSGNPDDFIELDDDDDDGNCRQMNADEQGVERLMERLMHHARGPAHSRKPKTVEIRYQTNVPVKYLNNVLLG